MGEDVGPHTGLPDRVPVTRERGGAGRELGSAGDSPEEVLTCLHSTGASLWGERTRGPLLSARPRPVPLLRPEPGLCFWTVSRSGAGALPLCGLRFPEGFREVAPGNRVTLVTHVRSQRKARPLDT